MNQCGGGLGDGKASSTGLVDGNVAHEGLVVGLHKKMN